jgi:hypothetical protein
MDAVHNRGETASRFLNRKHGFAHIDILPFACGHDRSHRWHSDHALIRFDFDATDRVTATDTMAVHRIHQSPLDMLRRWLGVN